MAALNNNNMANMSSPLQVATFNARGLINKKKRLALLRSFKYEKLDIIALQESHLVEEVCIKDLPTQWRGKIHFSTGTCRSKGLVTLFHPKFAHEHISLLFKSDRIIILVQIY